MRITKQCDQCSAPFTVSAARPHKQRFCTPLCRQTWRDAQRVTCAQCGRLFHVPPSHRGERQGSIRGRYCSRSCAAKARCGPAVMRFWPRVEQADGCWLWTGTRHDHGYGRLRGDDGRTVYTHRFAYALLVGPIPDGHEVLHRCDNPPCVRPDHLFTGPQRVNNADRDAKDRVRHGSRHANAKLTEQQVRRARTLYATGAISQRALAALFGVSHQTIADVVAGKTWRRA